MRTTLVSALALLAASMNSFAITTINDDKRQRQIPIAVSQPIKHQACTTGKQCSVAFINAGYGVEHTKYQFISNKLNELGYLSVAIGHELPSDPPLSISGNLFETRQENWQRGAKTVQVVREHLAKRYPNYDFNKLMLLGHSNGGDISSLLASQGVTFISDIITLDHRRVPLPRAKNIRVLSIRASDFAADLGVLPTEQEQKSQGSCVVKIAQSKHNDMSDYGPDWLKSRITLLVEKHIKGATCSTLKAIN
ncbi:hypothetical protein PSECIP111854_03333 [Pseudoalteromonas sp. CIP111854]|uniref:Alpha/beta hydrolase n=1 Tax=Pseudoalteromonas holothuriae TaxID=2963714 RepID=A0A9W4VYL5_9GAMM|nr:alpha/beta hydrolase [Pseudoalteromonas sp. CIP111854]CAH9063978.1 hypothetical protein PSECIP111854_03333 [Pseudoalteromonas sp. CIP111854]